VKLILLWVTLLAAACAGPAPEKRAERAAASSSAPAGIAAYYPLAVGNQWTYEFVSGEQRKRDTIRVVAREGGWFLDDHKGKLRVDGEGLRDPDHYLLRGPLEAGAKWSAVEDLHVQRFEITAADGAEVTPAGTFLHCVTVRNELLLPGDSGRFVTEWTYAPGVGLVRGRTSVQKPRGETLPQLTFSLVEYRLAP
jgi:hypothetical protein